MKPYVTYGILFNNTDPTDPDFVATHPYLDDLQAVTGAWSRYGINTPIYLVTILDRIGPQTLLSLIDRAVDLEKSVIYALCIDLIRLYSFPWKENIGTGTDRIDLLMDYCESLLLSQTLEEVKLDLCGDPIIPTPLVAETTALAFAQSIVDATLALPDGRNLIPYYTWTHMNPKIAGPVTQETKDYWNTIMVGRGAYYWETEYIDSDCVGTTDTPYWPTALSVDDRLEANPYSFLESYNAWLASDAVQAYTSTWVLRSAVFSQGGGRGANILAAQCIVNAAYALTEQIVNNTIQVDQVIRGIVQTLDYYYQDLRNTTVDDRMFWSYLTGWNDPTDEFRSTWEGYPIHAANPNSTDQVNKIATIRAQRQALELQLLTDATYIKNICGVNVDDAVEANKLFLAVRIAWQALVATAARAYVVECDARYATGWYPSQIVGASIRPYLL